MIGSSGATAPAAESVCDNFEIAPNREMGLCWQTDIAVHPNPLLYQSTGPSSSWGRPRAEEIMVDGFSRSASHDVWTLFCVDGCNTWCFQNQIRQGLDSNELIVSFRRAVLSLGPHSKISSAMPSRQSLVPTAPSGTLSLVISRLESRAKASDPITGCGQQLHGAAPGFHSWNAQSTIFNSGGPPDMLPTIAPGATPGTNDMAPMSREVVRFRSDDAFT
ncbi:hypothetical protein FALBO_2779 [Fusarium albosuccineum]|uniref:Uncharacterized protein n=1 Tax=Fusarium albosuccineum TaxID=1237068 RepID=A0A8H4LKD1_9HYPO|nr:hypothetical protein FALBO_2779 [Fusarium albosuccineum]